MIIGIGCDIVEIDRIKDKQEELAKRILTQAEYQLYKSYAVKRRLEFLVGRFAAKEAIFKACNKTVLISNIEVLQGDSGEPICNWGDYQIHISIAHEKHYAIAYAICEK
ncbi:holo-[acyl-carrier protein] synthase [Breznakia sp. PF5-3]|uniref:holo-ACP synthase n=1 Tax=unclassified Breznakia TaxID=2623764 RepID=UPI002407339A|nr:MULTISPECIES: holo-ACP synthase [unclassified Breznakia]MDL2276195.1 holo-ACP synthase [Breznakia sp. OttesenSCG-928-G09]MDF9824716.1 holo-[acyl-carrier protein] synthase [Breznakia sp. PM6-1]MDF9835379.1 holo-[acyl-carrier protein] synthase [Breznakia sp. PF5-3]MDF9836978.1 holo-[acyl-carrier protein] synthase [Breznakia sp. PFB2-8]MDF9859614.1 holo-[acyl-carrier protein] synthase [Breznakia sp. PH5-24]